MDCKIFFHVFLGSVKELVRILNKKDFQSCMAYCLLFSSISTTKWTTSWTTKWTTSLLILSFLDHQVDHRFGPPNGPPVMGSGLLQPLDHQRDHQSCVWVIFSLDHQTDHQPREVGREKKAGSGQPSFCIQFWTIKWTTGWRGWEKKESR